MVLSSTWQHTWLQDFRLTELAAQQGRAVVVVVNKWDKVDKRVWTEETYIEDVRAQLRHVSWASVVCTNARRGERAGVQQGRCSLWREERVGVRDSREHSTPAIARIGQAQVAPVCITPDTVPAFSMGACMELTVAKSLATSGIATISW